MPLDPSLFMQAAALRQKNNEIFLNSLKSGLDSNVEMQKLGVEREKAKTAGFDFDKLAQQSALRIQAGQGTPEDTNILSTWDKFNQTKLMRDPTTGEYGRANASVLGGFDIGGLRAPNIGPQGQGSNPAMTTPYDQIEPLLKNASLDDAMTAVNQVQGPEMVSPVQGAPGVGFNTNVAAPQIPPDIAGNKNANQKYLEGVAGELGKGAAEKQLNAPKEQMKLEDTASRMMNVDKTITDALNQVGNDTAGMGSNLKDIPVIGKGTKSYDLKATLDTIKADAAFSELQKMRDNSKTGGALGSISEKELDLLTSAAAALDQSQSPAKLKENLKKYQDIRRQTLKRFADAFEQDNGYRPDFDVQTEQKTRRKYNPASGRLE